MSRFWAVTKRELAEWRPVVWVTLAVAALSWALPWLPPFERHDPAEVRAAGGFLLAALLGLGLASFLGASLLGRDLASGRIGFYLGLPLSAAEIWLGKLVAGALLVYGAVLVVVSPAATGAGSAWLEVWLRSPGGPDQPTGAEAVVLLLVAPLLVMLLAHGVGLSLRARSPWTLVDIAGLGAVAWLTGAGVTPLFRANAVRELLMGLAGWAVLTTVGGIAAGWLQLRRAGGRLGVGHRWFAGVAWSVAVVASLGLVSYAGWVRNVGPGHLERVEGLQPLPQGDWVAISGPLVRRPDYQPWFLHNVTTGASLKVEGWLSWVAASADGQTAVWPQSSESPELFPLQLASLRLEAGGPLEPRLGSGAFTSLPALALSHDGARVAVSNRDRLAIQELDGGKILAAARVGTASYYEIGLAFLGSDTVRRYSVQAEPTGGPRIVVEDLTAGAAGRGSVRRVGSWPLQDTPGLVHLSADGRRAALWSAPRGLVLVDPESDSPVVELSVEGLSVPTSTRFLSGGRTLVAWMGGQLVLYDGSGQELWRRKLRGAQRVELGGEWRPGRYVAAVTGERSEVVEIDLRGEIPEVRTLSAGGGNLAYGAAIWFSGSTRDPAPGSLGARVFIDHELGRVLEVDPVAEEVRTLVGPGGASPRAG